MALCALLGCSAVVDPENLLVRCEARSGEADPCAELGLRCASGTCQSCDPSSELCDGRDNDCDGQVDEGHDADRDGFTWCGGGRPELVDCVPDDPSIHPPSRSDPDRFSAPDQEPCDGYDNDCDGEVDEADACESMRSCAADRCPGDLVCDPETQRCVAVRSYGSLCSSDAECGTGFCVSRSALGLESVLAESLCATACCRDADCGAGAVCVQSGSGVRVCLPSDIAGRENRQEGERCSSSAQCASGVCQEDRCAATCSGAADCEDETCRLNVLASSLLSGAGAFVCGPPGGRQESGALCSAFDPIACQSGLCWESRCAAPCGADLDCAEGLACRYIRVQGLLGGGRVTACVPVDGPGQTGGACCTSTDCAAGQTCRPARSGSEWGMQCGDLAAID
jgi:hypothetical protein